MREIQVFDNFVLSPDHYRRNALEGEFKTFVFPEATFHGISIASMNSAVPVIMQKLGGEPTLSFFRKSPLGQEEPHFIHTDIDMGDWSAIFYLNPDPPAGDGTAFWTHKATGATESLVPHERSEEGRSTEGWTLRELAPAKFNRLMVFPSSFFHSRAIPENWGEGDGARLTQVTFGRGDIFK